MEIESFATRAEMRFQSIDRHRSPVHPSGSMGQEIDRQTERETVIHSSVHLRGLVDVRVRRRCIHSIEYQMMDRQSSKCSSGIRDPSRVAQKRMPLLLLGLGSLDSLTHGLTGCPSIHLSVSLSVCSHIVCPSHLPGT